MSLSNLDQQIWSTIMSILGLSKFTLLILFSIVCFSPIVNGKAQSPEDLIINKERGVLDRWKTGDTFGFIEIAADEITYFDPGLEKRITGIKKFRDYLSSFNGTFSFPSY